MTTMSKEVMDLFNDPRASKVLATVDAQGKVNVVPKGTLAALDEGAIVFADIAGKKTNENLLATRRASVAAFKMPPAGYQVKGSFEGFQTSGELFDKIAARVKEMLKMDIKAVGVIKVEEVYSLM